MRSSSCNQASRRPRLCGLLTLLLLCSADPAQTLERLMVIGEIVQDIGAPVGRRSEFIDTTLLGVSGPAWGALNVGNFARGLEVGGTFFDGRRSSYTFIGTRRQGGVLQYTSLQAETSQRMIGSAVGMASLRLLWPDHPETDNLLLIPTIGLDQYLASGWSFVAFRAIVDPRPNTGVVFRIIGRAATQHQHLQAEVSPRTDGIINFGVQARWRWALAGYSYERDFDFTRFDRSVFSVGLQYDFDVH